MLQELESKSLKELIAIHNEANPTKPVRAFRTKKDAVRRAGDAIRAKLSENVGIPVPADVPVLLIPADEPLAATAVAKGGGRRRKPFDLAPRGSRIKPHRQGTHRAVAITLLQRAHGATLEEVMGACGWNSRQATEGIFLLHKHLNWGIKEDDKGRIRLIAPEKKA